MCSYHCGGEFKPTDKMSKEVLIKLIKQNAIVANDIENIILKNSTLEPKSIKLYKFYVNAYAFDVHDESVMIVTAESLDEAWVKIYGYIDSQYDKEDVHFAGEYPITDVVHHRIVIEMS